MSGNGERVISSGCGCRAVRGEAGKWRRHANTSRRASKGQEHINQYWRMSEDVTADAAQKLPYLFPMRATADLAQKLLYPFSPPHYLFPTWATVTRHAQNRQGLNTYIRSDAANSLGFCTIMKSEAVNSKTFNTFIK